MLPESILFKNPATGLNKENKLLSEYFSLQVLQGDFIFPYEMKKCCKKYKKGKRCKKCPVH